MAVDPAMPILIVDDYNTMVRIIRNLLKQLGFENVDDAPDGSTALQKLRMKDYGLVISDWNMEPMTGYDLLKNMRADPTIGKTPFIMVTAESKTENVIGEEGRRQQLHRQAVQRADAAAKDCVGLSRRHARAATGGITTTPAAASPFSGKHPQRQKRR